MIIKNTLTEGLTKPDRDLASSHYRNSQSVGSAQLVDLAVDSAIASRYPDRIREPSDTVYRILNFEELEKR